MNRLTHIKARSGFTLIEVVASLAILAILLSSVFVVYERTSSHIIAQTIEERALAVAQRQMEILIAMRQEPDSDKTSGWDDFDPMFQWHISLKRETTGSAPPKPNLTNTVIKAVVTVEWDERSNLGFDFDESYDDYDDGYEKDDFDQYDEMDDTDWDEEDWIEDISDRELYERNQQTQRRLQEVATKIELVRYFEHQGFKPIAGQPIAVPIVREIAPEPQWYLDLVDRLGREPTPTEIIQQMFKMGEISEETMVEMQFPTDPEIEDSEDDQDDIEKILSEQFPDIDLEDLGQSTN